MKDKFLDRKFSHGANSNEYRNNFNDVFGEEEHVLTIDGIKEEILENVKFDIEDAGHKILKFLVLKEDFLYNNPDFCPAYLKEVVIDEDYSDGAVMPALIRCLEWENELGMQMCAALLDIPAELRYFF